MSLTTQSTLFWLGIIGCVWFVYHFAAVLLTIFLWIVGACVVLLLCGIILFAYLGAGRVKRDGY